MSLPALPSVSLRRPSLLTSHLLVTLMTLFVTSQLITSSQGYLLGRSASDKTKCEPIQNNMCTELRKQGYNMTSFPNYREHRSQEEANLELNQFEALLTVGCYPHLRQFLCSLYIPLCTPNIDFHVPPCRKMCEQARDGCSPILSSNGFEWPFNCSILTPSDPTKMCIQPHTKSKQGNSVDESTKPSKKTGKDKTDKDTNSKKKRKHKNKKDRKHKPATWLMTSVGRTLSISCKRRQLISIRKIRHQPASKCCAQASKAVLQAVCDGKNKCQVQIKESTLGVHCEGNTGRFGVAYRCVRKKKMKKLMKKEHKEC